MQAGSSVAPTAARIALPTHWLLTHALRAAAGLAAGACYAVGLWSFWSQWGTSLAANCGLTLAAATALIGGLRAAQFKTQMATRIALTWIALGAAVATAPWISSVALGGLHWIPVAALEHPLVAVSVTLAAALACVGPTILLLCLICATPPRGTRLRSRIADPWLWSGAACSLAVIPLTSALVLGMQQLGWILAVGAVGTSIIEWQRRRSGVHEQGFEAQCFERLETRHPWHLTDLTHIVTGVTIGISCALTLHMNSQLQAGMTFSVFAAVAGVLVGASTGLALRVWRLRGRSMEAENVFGSGMLLSVAGVALLAAMFGLLIDLHLWLNATVSNHWVLMTARVFLAALPMAPCGLAIVIATDERPHMVRGHFLGDLSVVAASFAIGFAVFGWWAPEPSVVLPWFELLACGLAILFLRIAGLSTPIRRPTYLAALGTIALAAIGFWFTEYDPARAARLLYSTTTFSAYRDGVDENTLMVLDDGRLTALRSNGRSTWTVWKHHGAQLQFRENGIPRHITSVNLAICPQSSGELLPAVAPLVMHPNPRRVLLTGLGSTATLQACLAFPVTSLTCTEADGALIKLAHKTVAAELGADPLDDSRLQLLRVDPALAAAAAEEPYDVIIVASTQPSLFDAAGTTTTDYFARIARKLQPGGVVCVRFQYVDFGAEPLRTMLRTVGSVFTNVRTLESAPGELIILASGDGGPAIDAEFAKRAEASHVRRVMSQCGWDWSILLGLAAVDDAAADEIAVTAHPNTAADGRFAFTSAPEALRWGAKLAEIQQMLAAHTSQMLKWIGPCTEAEDVAKRLADVTEQRKVVHDNPEQFWSYRKTLKDRLQNRPRSLIVPVAHEGLQRRLHPEDERRKEYLKALGAAARQERPDAESIQRVAQFVDPFDPLVSFFAHHEAAYLWSRSAERDVSAELGHRMYTVYYGAGTDRSVRNVTATLELLLKSEESTSTQQARWDHMNSLLEVLRQRWAYRMQFPEQSRFAAADLDESLTVVRGTLAAMDEMHPELDLSRDHWPARRALLEHELVAPLKSAQVQQASRGTAGISR
jgi:hypothetical protein